MASFLQNVCDPFRQKAAARGVDFSFKTPAGTQAESDPVLLRSILTNLLDNAVAYTPPGGNVDVEADTDHGRLTLRVVNTVDNLEERDLPHLFERFWRKDAARSANGHTGLGLSVARTFAEAIGCQLTATFAQPGRLVLVLSQPDGRPVLRS